MTGARLRVDLARLRANAATLRTRVAPADILVVVKDDAYGHGVEQVVGALPGTAWFGAFDVATALRARAVAPDARILAWGTAASDEIAVARDAGIELGVGDAAHLEAVAGGGIRIHLKIDTGLHRNGVRREDWPAFVLRAAELQARGEVVVAGVWSHIAETSDEDDDRARAEFADAVTLARAVGLEPDVLHLAASAAGFARPEFRHDLVRFGAFVYGVRSADGPALDGIEPAASLIAPVTAVHGDEAEIAVGSLDGLPSSLAGRVSAATPDGPRVLTAVDAASARVAAWPGAAVGDEVVVLGAGAASATDLAEAIGTVGEEILVRLSPLLRREYVD